MSARLAGAVAFSALMLSGASFARTVSTGSAVCRPGSTVSIPVLVDDVADVSTVALTVNADSSVLSGLGVEAGELAQAEGVVTADDGAGRVYVLIPRLKASSGGGELCRLRYRVREGTDDLYSDIALANVQLCAADGVRDLSVANPVSIENGMVRVASDGMDGDGIAITLEDGDLSEETAEAVRDALADTLSKNPEVTSVRVVGDGDTIPVTVSLGIAPQVDILGTEATATYTRPSIVITSFDPATGAVRIRVDPGEGNAIRTTLATGCIHVYGTSNLAEKMRYIGNTSIDLTPYLKAETIGEADLTVDMGDHTFIKVKAETVIKADGESE